MSTLIDAGKRAFYEAGHVTIIMNSGTQYRFPTKGNPRLERASDADLNEIELSPFGIHWPTLDEDLSFEGIARGDYGQR